MTVSIFDEIHDRALQQERTVLAWDRTGLSLMVAAGFLERTVAEPLTHPVSMVAATVFLLGLALLVLGRTRYLTRWRSMHEGKGMLSAGPVVTVAAATVLLGATALSFVLLRIADRVPTP